MDPRALKPYLTLIALLAITGLALALSVDVRTTDEAGVRVALPDQIGAWRGEEMRFCLNPPCQKEFLLSQTRDRNVCPACGGKLDCMSKPERDLLPPDTELLKKRYLSPAGGVVYASIVMSGKERVSIHRPQMCLVGAGNTIDKTWKLPVPLEGRRRPLEVMVLDMTRRGRALDGHTFESKSYYAYWFVGKNRETPYHVQRMIWMATDRVLHNVSHRWAYIAVAGSRPADDSAKHTPEILDFVHTLYPQITLNTRG